MAKARVAISDQNSLELDTLRRSYNSLLIVLENIATEVDATTLTAAQGFTALLNALSTGTDSNTGSHVGTLREVYGVKPSPLAPPRRNEAAADLVAMAAADTF